MDGRSSPAGPSGAAGNGDGANAPKHNFKVVSGFTKSQIDHLRQQITIFKKIKKGEFDFDFPGYVPRSTTPTLPFQSQDRPMQAAYGGYSATQIGLQARGGGGRGRGRQTQSGPRPDAVPTRPPPADVCALPSWYQRPRGPIYDLAAGYGGLAEDTSAAVKYGYKPVPYECDIRAMVEDEADRQLESRRKRRLADVQSQLAAIEEDTTPHAYQQRRRLRVEEKKLRLVELQDSVRANVVAVQRELMELGDRAYKKLMKETEKAKELAAKRDVKRQKQEREEYFKSLTVYRRKISDAASEAKELVVTRNRQIVKAHERMSKDWMRRQRDVLVASQAAAKAKGGTDTADADYLRRVEALKANDMDAYRELLAEAQGREGPGGIASDDKYASLQEFLEKTDGYLQQLGGKIAALKLTQQRSEAAAAAAAEAEAAGLTEEEVVAAAEAAADQAAERGSRDLMDAANSKDGADGKQKYYALAHSESEKIIRQPRMLTAGTLRDYQIVSLQWMISLYNNRLNGILADEMGLGKTVQVCALIAYLWESKQNYGPHLIIVPNAVIVNWKSEIKLWLKNMSAVYYVGHREERQKLFNTQVMQLKFNVLVTTYEFIMRDRAKLSKVNWQYIIIDEAQRLKDREGQLARDLDRFRCNRRLLLTGTPLQNDLSELWSLLNLLLPSVFDSSKVFQQWFGDDSKKGAAAGGEVDWMEKEKKIVIISRLHQILEPFMLRRLVQDVESKLPPKITIAVHCPFSAYQAAVYDWVNKTGTLRVHPTMSKIGLAARQNFKGYLALQNRCMELRKVCNHPALNYPTDKGGEWRTGADLVRTCGKLWMLDRMLIKLRAAGHRVLLFSTMTKLLDLLEDYLKWRMTTPAGEGLEWCRIDGSTALDMREEAITQFNAPGSKKFIFLLSIRAAGRGLNLQTADTVVVYDPDPNPKNEEQAVARSHRIGQRREVRVLHMEAVMDELGAADDEGGVGGSEHGGAGKGGAGVVCSPDDTTWGTGGTRTFTESIESVVRNVVQQQKIEMADEVINAGRFDQQTSHAERRETLEKLMQEQSTAGTRSCASMSLKTLNARLARTPAEVELFNEMDLQADLWPGGLTVADETPAWIRYQKAARDEAVSSQATRTKPGLAGEREEAEKARAIELASGVELGRGARNRGGFVPGSYAAADRALTGEDARAVQLRAMKKAAEDKATTGGKAATAEVKAASTGTAPDAPVPTATTEVKVQTPEEPAVANAAEEVGMLEDDVLSEVTETENEALVEAGEEVGMDPAELSEEDEEYHKGEDEELAGIEEIGAHIDEDEDDLPPSPKFDHPPAAANDGPAPMDTDDAPAAPAAAKKLTFTFGKKK